MLEEAVREKTQLFAKHYDELKRAKMALDRVQTTYQTKLVEYEVQAKATTALIKQLKDKKQATENNMKLGIKRIQLIVMIWKNRTKTNINECSAELWKDWMKANIDDFSVAVWNQWSQQVAELQVLKADAKNQKKAGDNFYKM
mgnify:CR=1 FL=1